jgi:hypothetical protein
MENFDGIMHKIAIKDFSALNLGDKRRDENIVRHPGGSIPQHN